MSDTLQNIKNQTKFKEKLVLYNLKRISNWYVYRTNINSSININKQSFDIKISITNSIIQNSSVSAWNQSKSKFKNNQPESSKSSENEDDKINERLAGVWFIK